MRADRLAARAAQRLGELRVRFGHTRYERSVQLFLRGLGQEIDGVLGSDHGALDENRLVYLEEARMLGERRPNLRIAAAHERQHARNSAQVFGEVLSRHGAAVAANALGPERFEDRLAATLARDGFVFDLVVGDGVVGELGFGAMSLRDMHRDAFDERGHELMGRRGIGTHGALHVGLARDDVARAAGVKLAHGDHGGLVGGELAAHDGLQRIYDFGGDHHGVAATLRHGAVAGRAVHVHTEPIGVGHARTGFAADGTRVDLAPDMHGKRAVDTLAYAGLAHHSSAGAVLLGRLEHNADLAVDVVGHVAQNL